MLAQSPADGSHLVSAAHEAPINTAASLCRWMTNKQRVKKIPCDLSAISAVVRRSDL